MKFEMCVLLLSFIVCLGLASGRNIAESRLTKEFRRISESELVRSNAYSVELVKGSIYNWNVELRSIDEDSELYEDLQILKEIEGKDSILLNIKFTKEFPFTAPLVRIVCPAIASERVSIRGNVFLDMLTPSVWIPVYSVEDIILQVAETLVQGGARILFDQN